MEVKAVLEEFFLEGVFQVTDQGKEMSNEGVGV